MTPTPFSIATPACEQYKLFDLAPAYAIASNAHARNAYGTIAQDIVCAALALRPIPIDGRCAICPDAQASDGTLYEIKSVHRNGKLVIYDWRVEKERSLPGLRYALFVHRVRGARSVNELLAAYATLLELWVLPAHVIHTAARACPLRHLARLSTDLRNGYSRAGYVRGYRNVGLASLRPPSARPYTFTCYDRSFQATLRQ